MYYITTESIAPTKYVLSFNQCLKFEFSLGNTVVLKLLRDSFTTHCSSIQLNELIYTITRRVDQKIQLRAEDIQFKKIKDSIAPKWCSAPKFYSPKIRPLFRFPSSTSRMPNTFLLRIHLLIKKYNKIKRSFEIENKLTC